MSVHALSTAAPGRSTSTPTAADAGEKRKPRAGAALTPDPNVSTFDVDHSPPAPYTVNVMAPLLVGDPSDPLGPASEGAWAAFAQSLAQAKALGAKAISTDVWWGLTEKADNQFDFSYYDRVAKLVADAGLKWVPILSFHACGGNVGDTVSIPLPSFLGEKYASLDPSSGPDAPFSRSEQGHVNHESLSPWATPSVLGEYGDFMRAFQEHFAADAGLISEINVSLGPAGELRFPSYDSHDVNAGYPSRGALQAYSPLALASFRNYVLGKYGTLAGANEAWGTKLTRKDEILPPSAPDAFFSDGSESSAYGKDFFDWYHGSLLTHGREVLSEAIQVFDADGAPFKGIDLGSKVPGVHWQSGSTRAAELDAGLLTPSEEDAWNDRDRGLGYGDVVDLFRDLQARPDAPRMVLYDTAVELSDGDGGPDAASRPHSLADAIGALGAKEGVTVKGENALAGSLQGDTAWNNMKSLLHSGSLKGVTVLRAQDIEDNATAKAGFQRLAQEFN